MAEDGNAPATKNDLNALKVGLNALEVRLDGKIEQLRSEVNHGYNDIVERISDGETRLLKAFYDFGQSNQKRMTELEGNEAAIRSRLATIEDRLLQVEKRLNMPPQQTIPFT
jgi:predicted  nucleic acid-binding Zn-ribbon protein